MGSPAPHAVIQRISRGRAFQNLAALQLHELVQRVGQRLGATVREWVKSACVFGILNQRYRTKSICKEKDKLLTH